MRHFVNIRRSRKTVQQQLKLMILEIKAFFIMESFAQVEKDFIAFYDCTFLRTRTNTLLLHFPLNIVIRAGKMRFIVETRLDDVTLSSSLKGFGEQG